MKLLLVNVAVAILGGFLLMLGWYALRMENENDQNFYLRISIVGMLITLLLIILLEQS